MHYTYQCDQLILLYLSLPLLVYFNKHRNSSEIAITTHVQASYGSQFVRLSVSRPFVVLLHFRTLGATVRYE